jgi:hypothetical protein
MHYIYKAEKELDELYKISTLPYSPDREFMNNLCVEIIDEFLNI